MQLFWLSASLFIMASPYGCRLLRRRLLRCLLRNLSDPLKIQCSISIRFSYPSCIYTRRFSPTIRRWNR